MALPDPQSARVAREIFMRSLAQVRPGFVAARRAADSMRDVHLSMGEVLYREGEKPTAIYFVVSGVVDLEHEGSASWRFDERSVIGIVDVLQGRAHLRTARAASDVHLILLSLEQWHDILEDDFDFMRGAMDGMTRFLAADALAHPPDAAFAVPAGPPVRATLGGSPLSIVERIVALRRVQPFARMTMQALVQVARLATELELPAGAPLFRLGDRIEMLEVVVAGEVEIDRQNPVISARFGPHSLVCAMGPLGSPAHEYDARATVSTRLLSIPREGFFDVLEDHFEAAQAVLSAIAAERERRLAVQSPLQSPPKAPPQAPRP